LNHCGFQAKIVACCSFFEINTSDLTFVGITLNRHSRLSLRAPEGGEAISLVDAGDGFTDARHDALNGMGKNGWMKCAGDGFR